MNLSRKHIPDLAVLQAFEAAARHSNFTKAAVELNLTQSAVSRQVKALEDQLGLSLFDRVRKRVILSLSGRQLLPEVSRLLRLSEDMVLRARAGADGAKLLSIATLPTFGSRWLIPRLPGFLEKHPGTVLDTVSRSEPFDLKAENVDVAIHYGQPVWARGTCTYLCSEVILPVANPALIEKTAIASPEDLIGQPLLHLDTRPSLWAEWFDSVNVDWQRAYGGHRFDQFAMIIEAAIRGMGFALLPLYLIEEEMASDQLRIVFDSPISTDSAYYVVLPEAATSHTLAYAFRNWLLEQTGTKDILTSNR